MKAVHISARNIKLAESNAWAAYDYLRIKNNMGYLIETKKEWEEARQKEVERLQQESKGFERFVRILHQTMQVLASEPILAPSGQYQPRKRTQVHYLTHPRQTITHPRKTILHPQRSYDDVKAERINELTRLPVGVARCRVQNAEGKLEEHVIELAMSPTGLVEKYKVEQWIEEIKERMLNDGYLQPITDVEQEIAERHARLRQPQPQPISPAVPNQLARRKPLTGSVKRFV